MQWGRSVLFVLLLLSAAFAGCAGKHSSSSPGSTGSPADLVPVAQRHLEPFNVTGFYSETLHKGPYDILKGKSIDVMVNLPPSAGADAALGIAYTNLGLFLPEIPGCDWSQSQLPAQCHVPVIADAGPYYAASTGPEDPVPQTEGDNRSTEPAQRLGGFLIHNFVPHGYAVAQISVLGTGDSSFCQDLMGVNEQAGLNAAVEWLGTQPWSNGAVALTGRSYDGSTPWEAATFGNPHLKTIVPISGLTGVYELMWSNGSAESRGPGLLTAIYAAMTPDGDTNDPREAVCPDYAIGVPEAAAAYGSGGPNDVAFNHYWSDRYFLDRVVQNYHGSIYIVHGLQDWNVENHMSVPYVNLLKSKGLDVKVMLGQWNHMYPDRPSEHVTTPPGEGHEAYPQSVRYDYAQDLLEWFDHYLKGTGPQPALDVEVQDNHGAWRIESTYPPADQQALVYNLGVSMAQTSPGQPVIAPASGAVGGNAGMTPPTDLPVVFEAAALAEDTRVVGIDHLGLWVTPAGPGGQVYAELQDIAPNGTSLRLGHAIMDLRFAAGGKDPQPVIAGSRILAHMQFEAMDTIVPAGHHLRLLMTSTGRDYLPASTSAPVVVDTTGASILTLYTVQRGAESFFTPPVWSGDAKATPAQP
jgi:predicted acyl esterase